MDMPGVLWKKFDSLETASHLAFIGSIRDDILDIEELACGLLDSVRTIYPQQLLARYKLAPQSLELPPYELLQAIGAKAGHAGIRRRSGYRAGSQDAGGGVPGQLSGAGFRWSGRRSAWRSRRSPVEEEEPGIMKSNDSPL